MDNVQLYTKSSEMLTQARGIQLQIQQKELELNLLEINIRYNIGGNSDFSQVLKKQSLLTEINNLHSQLSEIISRSIEWALLLVEQELNSRKSSIFSLSSQAISSINSFLKAYSNKITVDLTLRMRLSVISSQLMFKGLDYMTLRNEIDTLERLLKAY